MAYNGFNISIFALINRAKNDVIVLELVDRALALSGGRAIKDVRAGLGYTCVMLGDDHAGLAYTLAMKPAIEQVFVRV